jgi:2,3-bisphosphoglycerate-independent phosphoglycerate mutase
MKYVVILMDGMADEPIAELGGKTPMMAAKMPNIARLAESAEVGLVRTVPCGMSAGSDIANLSILGYDPKIYYTGRSPLEAASIGVPLTESDITYRANIVKLSGSGNFEDLVMEDYSGGEIPCEKAAELIDKINLQSSSGNLQFFAGVSYRNCLKVSGLKTGAILTPPHDISGKKIGKFLPKGENAALLTDLIKKSFELFGDGYCLWFWGEGTKPDLASFEKLHGKKGAVISAVDLIHGIAALSGMKSLRVEGSTDNINSNFEGEAEAAVNALQNGVDFVYLHIEAPDECGHRGQLKEKILSLELIDERTVKPLIDKLNGIGKPYSILILPDHPTPVATRKHCEKPVPYLLYRSNENLSKGLKFNEFDARNGVFIDEGRRLTERLFQKV